MSECLITGSRNVLDHDSINSFERIPSSGTADPRSFSSHTNRLSSLSLSCPGFGATMIMTNVLRLQPGLNPVLPGQCLRLHRFAQPVHMT